MPSPELATGIIAAALDRAPVRVIAVTGGKGGVGKTSVAVNLAMAFVESGLRTLLLDTDLGLANVDVLLGINARKTLADVVAGRCALADTVVTGPRGLLVVPAASGKRNMTELRTSEHVGLIHAFSELRTPLDVMVIDTAAGISDSVLTYSQAAQDVIVTVCNEPASLTDAYALIKVLSQERGLKRVHVLANMTRTPTEGRELFGKLAKVSERFLDVVLCHAGEIPHDEWLRRAIQRRATVLDAFPSSPSAQAFRELARTALQWEIPRAPRGVVEFFVERLVGAGAAA